MNLDAYYIYMYNSTYTYRERERERERERFKIRTLARDRRTLKGVHAFGLLRMTAWFFAGHCARIMQVAGS